MEAIQRLEGLQTVETAQEALGLTRQSTINLLSKLKQQGHVTTTGGGKQPRIYKITRYKQRPRKPGMFDLLNKHNPHFKLAEWYDHQVHGIYTEEDAIIDAIETGSFRAILATLRMFNHVNDWPKLYKEAKKRNIWNKVGALYDVARMFFRTRRMPQRYRKRDVTEWQELINKFKTTEEWFKKSSEEWNIHIPFNRHDVRDL